MRTKKNTRADINSFIWAHWHSRSDARLGVPRAADAAPAPDLSLPYWTAPTEQQTVIHVQNHCNRGWLPGGIHGAHWHTKLLTVELQKMHELPWLLRWSSFRKIKKILKTEGEGGGGEEEKEMTVPLSKNVPPDTFLPSSYYWWHKCPRRLCPKSLLPKKTKCRKY